MTHDWLLVETLGSEPAVVAQGRRTKNLVPISAFLRRNPNLMAIQTAIGETVRAGDGLSSITPKNDRVIRTEVVQMSDGRIHGVHVWIGPPDMEPPERPIPGPLKWDLTNGVATDTPESLLQQRVGPRQRGHPRQGVRRGSAARATSTRARPRCCRWRSSPSRARRSAAPGTSPIIKGEPITVGFVARVLAEERGRRQRAADLPGDELAQRTRGRDRIRTIIWHSESSTVWPNPACTARWST